MSARQTPNYRDLLLNWGVDFSALESAREIEGSPERTLAREVVSDTAGSRWILEQIEPDNLARKKQIAEQLVSLKGSGLDRIHPWQLTQAHSFFAGVLDQHWMLRPFVEGVPLDRTVYLNDSWRVDAMAEFLVQLREKTRGLSGPLFSITAYAENRMADWQKRYSKLAEKLEPSFSELQKNFFPVHDRLPVALCHGDYHPLNMVWGEGEIHSVIDWEFCGIKPELYDVALLLGCIGFDDPDNLIKEPVIRLVRCLRSAGFGEAVSWEYLLDLMAVIRYGWMSEWIRRSDREARKMEVIYIDILVSQQETIQQRWS